ncbi:MAG: SMP-30/gluconolactonase/LRE family protein [Chromatiales bacterium]|jgi:xylono-1,5-lactonase|nr:SMP-30/gluconolactonase/LRE family protein [Chromatiales bacterium]
MKLTRPGLETLEELATGYGLIEGPTWDATRGLIYSDVHNGGVFCLNAAGTVTTVVEHRRGIGGIALHADGGLIVGGRNVAYKGPGAGGTAVLLGQDCVPDIIGFNDLTTDSAGRIYVGSLGSSPFEAESERRNGFLHLIDLDGSSRVLAPDIKLTNGLAFSPDGKRLYHSDSRNNIIGMYAVEADGNVGPREVFTPVEPGIPDGLCVAEDGSVWVAAARGDAVLVFEADGTLRQRIDTVHMPTSVCFGGDDLRDLYIVSGSDGTGKENGGSVFRMRVDVPGLPVAVARIPIP